MFRLKMTICFLAFFMACALIIPLITGFIAGEDYGKTTKVYIVGDGEKKVVETGPDLLASFRGFLSYSKLEIMAAVETMNSERLKAWIAALVAALCFSFLIVIPVNRGYKNLIGRLEGIGAGNYKDKLTEKGMFSELNRSVNTLTQTLSSSGEAQKKRGADTSESLEAIIGQAKKLLAESKGKMDVLAESLSLTDAMYGKKLLAEVCERVATAEKMLEQCLFDRNTASEL